MNALVNVESSANGEPLWVLGHRIRPWVTDESYGLIEVTSPPHVPGPPPHFHASEREFFLILNGTLTVMADGVWQTAGPGTFIELEPGVAHTFINNTEQDVVWVTGWRPKGFERFFLDFGVPVSEAGAQRRSVSEEVIAQVLERCERYGMHLSRA